MRKPTNKLDAFKFTAFLEEGLTFVDCWTPTDINSGGCGIFAILLSDELTKMGIDHKIIALYMPHDGSEKDNADVKLTEFINTGKKKGKLGISHVVIKLDELYLDSSGIVNPQALRARTRVEIPKDKLQQLVDEKINWNPTFDRGCTNVIKEKLAYMFSNYSNFNSGYFSIPGENEVSYTEYTIKQKKQNNPFAEMLNRMLAR